MDRDGEDADELRRQLADSRDKVIRDVQRMADKIRILGDWHEIAARYPWCCLGAAAALGYFLVPAKRSVVLVREPRVVESALAGPSSFPWTMLLGRLVTGASQLAVNYALERLSHGATNRPRQAKATTPEPRAE